MKVTSLGIRSYLKLLLTAAVFLAGVWAQAELIDIECRNIPGSNYNMAAAGPIRIMDTNRLSVGIYPHNDVYIIEQVNGVEVDVNLCAPELPWGQTTIAVSGNAGREVNGPGPGGPQRRFTLILENKSVGHTGIAGTLVLSAEGYASSTYKMGCQLKPVFRSRSSICR